MFKKSERLNRTAFTKYFKIGRRFQTDNFTLIYSLAPVRAVAVVVGKKVHKLAVDRNTLRRSVYGAARVALDADTTLLGIFIIISKPTAKNLTKAATALEVNTLLALTIKSR